MFKVGDKVVVKDIIGKRFQEGTKATILKVTNDKYTYFQNCYQIKNEEGYTIAALDEDLVAA